MISEFSEQHAFSVPDNDRRLPKLSQAYLNKCLYTGLRQEAFSNPGPFLRIWGMLLYPHAWAIVFFQATSLLSARSLGVMNAKAMNRSCVDFGGGEREKAEDVSLREGIGDHMLQWKSWLLMNS